jgi:ketosteroid isomerase-like protein
MKKLIYSVLILSIALITGCDNKSKKVDKAKEVAAIKLVLEKYALANENEDMGLIEDIWCPSESIVSFGTEGGEKHIGFKEIKKAVQNQFNSFSDTYISYRDQIVEINQSGNTAWFSEIINYNFILNDEANSFEGLRYTGVLVKKDGKWKLVQTHMSVPYGYTP